MRLSRGSQRGEQITSERPKTPVVKYPGPKRCRPKAIVVIMDDLAWGDLACHGNPHIATPHLDAMHGASARGTRHCSGPLCSPAREALMTGRYHLRTRVIDTYCGRSMLEPSEPTIARDCLAAGMQTGCFGKWHLGDTPPMRPQDLGFTETLVHQAGGIGQPGDLWQNHQREKKSYFDPVLLHNGQEKQTTGSCTDIFFDAAIEFIQKQQANDQQFFVYLATNAPHSPLIVADEWAQPYRDMGLPDEHARLYGMVANIDWNMGRLAACLADLGIADTTLVHYTSDHGPCGSSRASGVPEDQRNRFNAGLRGMKSTHYEGGIRVPAFWQCGSTLTPHDLIRPTHPIDVAPTIRDALGIERQDHLTEDREVRLPITGQSQKPTSQIVHLHARIAATCRCTDVIAPSLMINEIFDRTKTKPLNSIT